MSVPQIFVTVNIRPYLADYFKHYYGEHPIKANEKSKLFPMLSTYLTHPPVPYKPIKVNAGTLIFQLPYNEVIDIRKNNYISPRHFSDIQSFLYGVFYSNFIDHMNYQCIKLDKPFKCAIIIFMESNDISYDRFQYDSLKRIYFRYRKKFFK